MPFIKLCNLIKESDINQITNELSFLSIISKKDQSNNSFISYLQAYCRRYIVKENIKLKHEAASKIQKSWRFYIKKKKSCFFFNFVAFDLFLNRIHKTFNSYSEKLDKLYMINKAKLFFPYLTYEENAPYCIDQNSQEYCILKFSIDHENLLDKFDLVLNYCNYEQVNKFISIFFRLIPYQMFYHQHLLISHLFQKYLTLEPLEKDNFKTSLVTIIKGILDLNAYSEYSSIASPIFSYKNNRTSLSQHEKYLKTLIITITDFNFYKSEIFFLSQKICNRLSCQGIHQDQIEQLIREFIFLPFIQTNIFDKLTKDFHDSDDIQLQLKMIGFIVKKRFFNKTDYAKAFNQTIHILNKKFFTFFQEFLFKKDYVTSFVESFAFPEIIESLFMNKITIKFNRMDAISMREIMEKADSGKIYKSYFDKSSDNVLTFPYILNDVNDIDGFVRENLLSNFLLRGNCNYCLISFKIFINLSPNPKYKIAYSLGKILNCIDFDIDRENLVSIIRNKDSRCKFIHDVKLLNSFNEIFAKMTEIPDDLEDFILHMKSKCLSETITYIYQTLNLSITKLDRIDKTFIEQIGNINNILEYNLNSNIDETSRRRSLKNKTVMPLVNPVHTFPVEFLISKEIIKFVENFTKPQLPNLEMQITQRKDKSNTKFQISMIFSKLPIGQTLIDIFDLINLLPKNKDNLEAFEKEYFKILPFISISIKNFLVLLSGLFFAMPKSKLKNIKQRISIKKGDSLKRTLSRKITGLSQKINPLFE